MSGAERRGAAALAAAEHPVDALLAVLRDRSLPQGSIRWDRVLALARRHGLSGLCAPAARRHPEADAIPLEFRDACLADQRTSAIRNALFLREAHGITAALTQARVRHRFFKGVALLDVAYPDHGTRVLSDIDLIVAPGDLETALRTLAGLGYSAGSADPLRAAQSSGEVHLYAAERSVGALVPNLDLHVEKDYTHFYGAAPRRNSVQSLLLGADADPEAPLPTPGTEAHIAVLVLHMVRHFALEGSVKWYWDLLMLSERRSCDWRRVVALLRENGGETAGWLVLRALRDELGVAVPEDVLAEIRPPGPLVRFMGRAVTPRRLLRDRRAFRNDLVGILWRGLVFGAVPQLLGGLSAAAFPGEGWLRAQYAADATRPLWRLRLAHGGAVARWAMRGGPRARPRPPDLNSRPASAPYSAVANHSKADGAWPRQVES